MAASYIVISAVAVLLVEAVVLAYFIPRMKNASNQVAEANAQIIKATVQGSIDKAGGFAAEDAAVSGGVVAGQGRRSNAALLATVAANGFGQTVDEPEVTEALAALDGRVVATTNPQIMPVGSMLPPDAISTADRSAALDDSAAWATRPVLVTSPAGATRAFGIAYVKVSPVARTERVRSPGPAADKAPDKGAAKGAGKGAGKGSPDPNGMLIPGLIMLALLIPVGGMFGLLTTRRLIGRIQRLADGSAAMAAGDLRSRIPVSGGDEVGRLEHAFNRMAERLELAVQAERHAAGVTERNRIARDLHDSVSQDVFSANLLAGGLRRALPAGSELRRQAESMERTLERTMREMRAMLLELRPVALEEAGLAAALTDLCQAYEVRLGIQIRAAIDAPELSPAVELAVLRVVQEALGNAARHAEPECIELRVTEAGGQIMVLISDDGRGFDPAGTGGRHGMGMALMRERVTELGGTFEVASVPAEGTTVRVRIPA